MYAGWETTGIWTQDSPVTHRRVGTDCEPPVIPLYNIFFLNFRWTLLRKRGEVIIKRSVIAVW